MAGAKEITKEIAQQAHQYLNDPNTVIVCKGTLTKELMYDRYANYLQGLIVGGLAFGGERFSNIREIFGKPNGVDKPCDEYGIVTNPYFFEGCLEQAIKVAESAGIEKRNIGMGEGVGTASSKALEGWGFFDIADRLNNRFNITNPSDMIRFQELYTAIPWTEDGGRKIYDFERFNVISLHGKGYVHEKIPFVRDFANPNSYIIMIPTLKTHNLPGLTICVKLVQGAIPEEIRHFCCDLDQTRKVAEKHPDFFREGFEERVMEEYERHISEFLKDGSPKYLYWNVRRELWAQRAGDATLALQPWIDNNRIIYIVDGGVGRDGTAFRQGKDHFVNLYFIGRNPIAVDRIAGVVTGNNNVGYLHILNERGFGETDLNKLRIISYEDGELRKIDKKDAADFLAELLVPLGALLSGVEGREVFLADKEMSKRVELKLRELNF